MSEEYKHKRQISVDLNKSDSVYVNFDEALKEEKLKKANTITVEEVCNQIEISNDSNDSSDSSDSQDTQPLTPTPMFKDDEDIYIQDDGTMLIKQDHGN